MTTQLASRPVIAVLGVDRWVGQWVGIVLDGAHVEGFTGRDITSLVGKARGRRNVTTLAIDIPIGLPAGSGGRAADRLARARVGGRASSVFPAPNRAAIEVPNYREALAVSRLVTGKGLSRQAWALGPAILETARFVETTDLRVVEAHPEVSFAQAAGGPLRWAKKTWGGLRERLDILEDHGLAIPQDLGDATAVAVEDVLDAAIVAWTARRVALGTATSYPDPPELFTDGWPAAIWA